MKDILKNPVLYYIAVPVLAGLWPLLVFAVYLPAARTNMDKQIKLYKDANDVMVQILTLDPDRLKLADANIADVEFTYDKAVFQIASLCNIPSAKFDFHSLMVMTTGGQKTQSAKVSLKQVDITTFAKFLSMIQTRWPNLQGTILKMDKKENLPDVWDIDIDFKYYF